RQNAARAGVADDVDFQVANFEDSRPPAPRGMLLTNPPYDRRMKAARIAAVYRRLGDVLKQHWAGYVALVLTGNLDAAKQVGLRASGKTRLFNGPIECRLLRYELFAGTHANQTAAEPGQATERNTVVSPPADGNKRRPRGTPRDADARFAEFRNRLV